MQVLFPFVGYGDHSDHFTEGIRLNEEQKQRLLDNSEKLERAGNHLTTGYQILLETEEIGSQVLRDLSHQRETIQKSRSRVSILLIHFSVKLNSGYKLIIRVIG